MLVGRVGAVGSGIDVEKFARLYPALAAEIRLYDPKVLIYYDSNVARYGIARMGDLGVHHIDLWQDEAGNPRPIDRRLLDTLRAWDLRPQILSAARTANEESDRRDAADEARRAKAESDFDDDMDHLARSNRRQLRKAVAKFLNVP